MPTFIPPTSADRARDQRVAGAVRRWPPHDRGHNVFKLTDGSYTEVQPSDMTTVDIEYLGAHIHTVTDAEAAALTAAGYSANIT